MKSSNRDRLRTAANVVGVLLLIGVVAPFVVYGAPQVVGADHGFVVLSGSMEPAMSPGDAVIVREAAPEDVAEGDIITYGTDGDTPTTHRVVDVVERDGGAAYVTKGDANEDPDTGTVPHDRVIGEVLFVIPLIGYVVQFANTATGFVALVAVPLGLFVLSELRTLVRSIDEGGAPAEAEGGDDAESASGVDVDSDGPNDNADSGVKTVDSDDDDDSNSSSITLTRSSLQLLAFVFGAYIPYSAYVAYTTPEAWSIGAAVATGIGFLFSVALYLGSGGSAAPADGEAPEDGRGAASNPPGPSAANGDERADELAAADGGTNAVADPDSMRDEGRSGGDPGE